MGRYEGDVLVIESTGIRANTMPVSFRHSDQLRIVERYTRSEDGERLVLSVTYEDPVSLKEPLVLKKIWSWAPDEEIFPYVDCELPTEFLRRGDRP